MQLAPLQLTDYFVHSIRVEASPAYNPENGPELDISALEVESSCAPLGDDPDRRFAVEMTIRQNPVAKKNVPYHYEIKLVGFIAVHPDFPADKLARTVEINGPSMLFGAAREILRAATGRGPYGPILIPSATFFTPSMGASEAKAITKKADKMSIEKAGAVRKKATLK